MEIAISVASPDIRKRLLAAGAAPESTEEFIRDNTGFDGILTVHIVPQDINAGEIVAVKIRDDEPMFTLYATTAISDAKVEEPGLLSYTAGKPKYTPGEWTLYKRNYGSFDIIIANDKGQPIKSIAWTSPRQNMSVDEAYANARLISCAPELLEMLDEIVEVMCMTCKHPCNAACDIVKRCNYLIAKAKGGLDAEEGDKENS